MAPPARSRPASATTVSSSSTTKTSSSFFTDRSGIPGLEGVPNATRPLPDLLNLVLDAAHVSHDNKKLLHPPTPAYSLFNWRVASSIQQPGLTASSSSVSAGHSSTSVHARSNPQPTKVATKSAETRQPHPAAYSNGESRGSTGGILANATIASTDATKTATLPGDDIPASTPTTQPPISKDNTASSTAWGPRLIDAAVPSTATLVTAAEWSSSTTAGNTGAAAQGAGSSSSACSAPGAAAAVRGPREIARPAVVARALSPWEGAELEVVCLYDSNFQPANQKGQHGLPLRVPANKHIGPISYLYRWYCKRSTQFRGGDPSPGILADAPAMPPPQHTAASHSCRPTATTTTATPSPSATSTASPGTSGFSNNSSYSHGAGGGFLSGAKGGAKGTGAGPFGSPGGAGGPVPVWRPPPPSRSASGGVACSASATAGASTTAATPAAGGFKTSKPGGVGATTTATTSGGGGGGGATTRGRCLNLGTDPVISLGEVVDLLEDLQVVPQLASRLDVKQLFQAASSAGAAAASGCYPLSPAPQLGASRSGRQGGSPAVSFAPSPSPSQQQQQQQYPRASAGSGARLTRPASAPRAATRATSAGSGPGGPGSSGGGDSGAIPRAQVHPEEVRFPVFKDLLVRLAVAIASADPPVTKPEVAAAAAKSGVAAGGGSPAVSATAKGNAAVNAGFAAGAGSINSVGAVPAAASRVSAAGSGSVGPGGVALGWGRTMSAEDAVRAVRRLLEHMGLYRKDLRGLRHRLDELARLAAVHSATAQANRRRYVAVPSPVAAAQDVAVAASPAPSLAAGRPAAAPTWGVLSAFPAPAYLLAVLAAEDQGDDEDYRPAWREFGSRALELGVLQPGEWRQCRLLLHARGPHTLSVRLDAADAPFCRLSHVGLHAVPPGMPLRVDVAVQWYEVGEVVGEIRLQYSSSQDRREREVVVPVYGMVCPPGVAAAAGITAVAGQTRPRAPSERSAMAAKATREPVAVVVARGAAAAAPLGHRGPWTAMTTATGSVGSGGSRSVVSAQPSAAAVAAGASMVRTVYDGPRRAWLPGGDGGGGCGDGQGADPRHSRGAAGPVAGLGLAEDSSGRTLEATQSLPPSAPSAVASPEAGAAPAAVAAAALTGSVGGEKSAVSDAGAEEDDEATEIQPPRLAMYCQDMDPYCTGPYPDQSSYTHPYPDPADPDPRLGPAVVVRCEESGGGVCGGELSAVPSMSLPASQSRGSELGLLPRTETGCSGADGDGWGRSAPLGHEASDAWGSATADDLRH